MDSSCQTVGVIVVDDDDIELLWDDQENPETYIYVRSSTQPLRSKISPSSRFNMQQPLQSRSLVPPSLPACCKSRSPAKVL